MNKKLKTAAIACVCLFAASTSSQAEEATLVLKRPVMTLDAAGKVADATIKACRKEGVNVAVTVIDRNGQILAVQRDTLAMVVTLDLSRLKAVTALSMNSITGTLGNRYKRPGALEYYDGLLFMPGGAPINAGGAILGAVGVSGAPDSKIDERCALDGIKAISTDLEMAM